MFAIFGILAFLCFVGWWGCVTIESQFDSWNYHGTREKTWALFGLMLLFALLTKCSYDAAGF